MNLFDDMDDFFLSREDRFSLPIDLMEDENNYIIHANIPGFNKDEISINVNKAERYIDIKVEKKEEKSEENSDEKGIKYLHRERYFGAVSRRIRFGTPIDPDNAKTDLKEGILTVTIPKSEEAKTVALSIK